MLSLRKYWLCMFSVTGPGGCADAPTDLRATSPVTVSGKRCTKAEVLKAACTLPVASPSGWA
eukprot:4582924-Pyramimonas_sp.AAC.1